MPCELFLKLRPVLQTGSVVIDHGASKCLVEGVTNQHVSDDFITTLKSEQEMISADPPCARRVLTEWLQDEASEKGRAAAVASGAGAVVEAAAASAQLEVIITRRSLTPGVCLYDIAQAEHLETVRWTQWRRACTNSCHCHRRSALGDVAAGIGGSAAYDGVTADGHGRSPRGRRPRSQLRRTSAGHHCVPMRGALRPGDTHPASVQLGP